MRPNLTNTCFAGGVFEFSRVLSVHKSVCGRGKNCDAFGATKILPVERWMREKTES